MPSVFSTAVLPSIEYMQWFIKSKPLIDVSEPFQKQSNRNRYHILSANGLQTLVIPLSHVNLQQHPISQTKLVNDQFKRNHWRSIESAYNRSAFFEFYKDAFYGTFFKEEPFLHLFNMHLLNWILLQLKTGTTSTLVTVKPEPSMFKTDLRKLSASKTIDPVLPESTFLPYNQVFSYKTGFIKNLSIIDLLFNCGPASLSYLNSF